MERCIGVMRRGDGEIGVGAWGTGGSKEERLKGGEAQDDREYGHSGLKSKEKRKLQRLWCADHVEPCPGVP